ncbi:MAG TPA: AAA family ATPase [Ktedonobacteraceae bacterium]|nr:AAA family ATPase [Ktedonobacteraceae bacterium]
MGLLRVAVLGPPEVFHEGKRLSFALRKAQALLLYLAVEGGMHSRNRLTALLWPGSEPADARRSLRNALVLLRQVLADAPDSPHPHLVSEGDLLGLNLQAPFELDLEAVQQAYQQVLRLSTAPPPAQSELPGAHLQQALTLVRGPFLDSFWLGEETPFDDWVLQQQRHWHLRLQVLYDQLSHWQEAAGDPEQSKAILTRWLALDPLAEEASRRLMRLHLAEGNPTAAWQIYTTLRGQLAQQAEIKPAPETQALAERIQASASSRRNEPAVAISPARSQPPGELTAPLIGRASAFSQLVASYQHLQKRRPQAALLVGEAGIGKTRLAHEFVRWCRTQGADILIGHAFEMRGRLPYQPLIEALRERLEVENAPEDLLEDLWLAELSRLLPELRLRYPDLPVPVADELTAHMRLFEAVVRLLDVFASRAPLVLLLEHLDWIDEASLDLLHYLAHAWKKHGTRAFLLGTARPEGLALNTTLADQLLNLGRDLPLTRVNLQPLSLAETYQLLEALVREQEPSPAHSPNQAWSSPAARTEKRPLEALGDFLFAQTGGQPGYLLETLKLLRERLWLVPQAGGDGTWWLEPGGDLTSTFAQEQLRRDLVPASVRIQLLARLAKLSSAARQVVMASVVLGGHASAQQLWQVADLEAQAGIEALEEAVRNGILGEAVGESGRQASYGFSQELVRQVVLHELGEARRQVLFQRAANHSASEVVPLPQRAFHASWPEIARL